MTILPDDLVARESSKNSPTRVEILDKATKSVKWTFLAGLAPRVVTPLSTIILAAILTPEDFGVVAISTFVISLAQIMSTLGMVQVLIQRRSSDLMQAASNAFWINLFTGLGLYCCIWLLAPSLAQAYLSPILVDVLRVSGLALPLNALSSIPSALMQRDLDFRMLLWMNITSMAVPAVVSVIFAIIGLGLWSLIIGTLAGALASTLVAWLSVRWRPKWQMEWLIMRSLLKPGFWNLITGSQTWLVLYADNALAGLFFGTAGLGVYSMGFNLGSLIPGFLIGVVGSISYPLFCELYRKGELISVSLMQLQELTAIILVPTAFGVSAVANASVTLLYGSRWTGLGVVIGWLAILPATANLWGLNGEAYRAMGRPDILAKLVGVAILVMFPLLIITRPLGLNAFVIARFAGAAALPIINIFVTARVFKVPIKQQLKILVVPVAASLVMFMMVRSFLRLFEPLNGLEGWLIILASIVIGALIYFGIAWWLRRSVVLNVVRLTRRAMMRG